jgi:tau tubulin kinase
MSALLSPGATIGPYSVLRHLGHGTFAEVYLARPSSSDSTVAIKLEKDSNGAKSLEIEHSILTAVQPSPFFPSFVSAGTHGDLHYLVIEVLGPSLSAVQRALPSRVFSLSTILRLALEMLRAIETFHARGYVNRDVKPDNFLLRGTLKNPIALIDYGLARLHIENGEVVAARERCAFCGTAAFASVRTHEHGDLGRGDDLWSWLYCVVFLAKGELPWQGVKDKNEMCELKKRTEMGKLCEGFPGEMTRIGEGIAGLGYADKPDYEGIVGLLENAMKESGVGEDDRYDWEWMPDAVWDGISAVPREIRGGRNNGGCCRVL